MTKIFNKNGFCIYTKGRGFYYTINDRDPVRFSPYKINGEKNQQDIEDIKKLLDDEDKQEILDNIKKIHEEHVDQTWAEISAIKEQLEKEKQAEEDKKEAQKEANKKKGRTRPLKIPIEKCKDIKELTADKTIENSNFYVSKIDDKNYLIDIIKTSDMQFYVRITDITDGYEEIDFNEFKKKYAQPSLFDFWNI